MDKSGTLTFINTTLTQCIYIDIVNDNVSEMNNECFTVKLSSATEITDTPNVTTVCITDNDG